MKARGGAVNAYAVCTAQQKKKRNPAAQAAEAFQEFQGRESLEEIVVKDQVHYHKHLAAAGRLEKLEVVSRAGEKVSLYGFKKAMLCFNERRNQLFIIGGDQRVDLKQFGISPSQAHETETLGEVVTVEYFTTKEHLGSEGGTAIYRHKFSRPYPELVYDVPNEQLTFSGGKYIITPEGIDK